MPDTFAIVDGAGKYLMPGLADMHVHLEYGDDPRVLDLFLANGGSSKQIAKWARWKSASART